MRRCSEAQAWIAGKAEIGRGQLVLEACTGPLALFAICLAELMGGYGLVVAIDRERSYAPAITKAIRESGFGDAISFLLPDLRYIPLRDGCVDAAVSLDTVQNMYGDGESVEEVVKRYIRESTRVVKPRGRVLVGTKHGIPANKAQEVYLRLHLFWIELEHICGERVPDTTRTRK